MKFEQLKHLIKEVMDEDDTLDPSELPNATVKSYLNLMVRNARNEDNLNDLATVYSAILSDPENAINVAKKLGIRPGVVNWHKSGILQVRDSAPSGQQMKDAALAAIRKADQDREAETVRRKEQEKIIKMLDPLEIPRIGNNVYRFEDGAEPQSDDEAREKFKQWLESGGGRAPGKVSLHKDPEGRYFILLNYGRLGT